MGWCLGQCGTDPAGAYEGNLPLFISVYILTDFYVVFYGHICK